MISPEALRRVAGNKLLIASPSNLEYMSEYLIKAAEEIERLKQANAWIREESDNRATIITSDKFFEEQYQHKREVIHALEIEREKLLACARSVLSEEGVREYLAAYTQGVELIRLVEEMK